MKSLATGLTASTEGNAPIKCQIQEWPFPTFSEYTVQRDIYMCAARLGDFLHCTQLRVGLVESFPWFLFLSRAVRSATIPHWLCITQLRWVLSETERDYHGRDAQVKQWRVWAASAFQSIIMRCLWQLALRVLWRGTRQLSAKNKSGLFPRFQSTETFIWICLHRVREIFYTCSCGL